MAYREDEARAILRGITMCKRASFIAIRGGKVAWILNDDSHDHIVAANNLKDAELCKRDFIRIEVTPKVDPFSRDPAEWEIHEDETELPSWYDREEWYTPIMDELILRRIPQELVDGHYAGYLDLRGTGITSLGNLVVKGNVYRG
jgi:hypothetical protein